jgi:DNA-binding NtrC family response regulator
MLAALHCRDFVKTRKTMSADSRARILIIDDDTSFLAAAAEIAHLEGLHAETAPSLGAARSKLRGARFDLVLLDLELPDGNGLVLLDEVDLANNVQVAIITGNPSVESAVRAIHLPVVDYLIKPLDHGALRCLFGKATTSARQHSAQAIPAPADMQMIGASAAMRELDEQIRRVAPLDVTVLLCGESGTGKELVGRALHRQSGRRGQFVAINCGAVPADLLGSQLFGHEKGSFTGAVKQHTGCFEQAHGGTLFLDEITEMPLAQQVHLLRVLETRAITRIGGTREQPVDVRIIATTNRDPRAAVADGRLREDLYYRLHDFPLLLAPLRERIEDIPVLAQYFLDRLNMRHHRQKSFSATALEQLSRYAWPGNVRELRHIVQRAFILFDESVEIGPLGETGALPAVQHPAQILFHVGMTLEEMERQMLFKTLAYFNNHKPKAAQTLGISLKTVYNHLAKFGYVENAAAVVDG